MESSGQDARGELTEEERSQLGQIRGQLDDAGGFLDGVLRGWNHGAKTEYQHVEELAKAVSEAQAAAGQTPN